MTCGCPAGYARKSMYGLKLKTWKSSLLIVASLIAVILAFSYLPLALLVTFGGLAVLLAGSYVLGHNTWKQTKDIVAGSSQAAAARPAVARLVTLENLCTA